MNPDVRVLLFTGEGKGKTTAALGLALRAVGHRMAVAAVQFIKCDDTVGELQAAGLLPGITVVQAGRGFLPKSGTTAMAEHQAAAEHGLRMAEELLSAGKANVVILDEICVAVARGLLNETDVLAALQKSAAGTCVVLTGRGATQGLIDAADTVTEMRDVKHGYRAGIAAQQGVEW